MFQENSSENNSVQTAPSSPELPKTTKGTKSFNIKIGKNAVIIGLIILVAVIAALLLFAVFGNNVPSFLLGRNNAKAITEKAINYLNNNVLQGQTATLGNISEESGVIKFQVVINGSTYDSYLTKDGKLFFPEAFDISSGNDSKPGNNTTAKSDFNITQENHIKGNFSAPVTLVEFSDFECPFCEKHVPTLEKILQEYKDQVRLVYKHFPLSSIHPNAKKAAEASECAAEQGKFWEYHDLLFLNQKNGLSVEKFKKWAVQLNLNVGQFNNCLDASKYKDKVQADEAEGRSKGVEGTPGTFINGELVEGAVPFETFKAKIDALLK